MKYSGSCLCGHLYKAVPSHNKVTYTNPCEIHLCGHLSLFGYKWWIEVVQNDYREKGGITIVLVDIYIYIYIYTASYWDSFGKWVYQISLYKIIMMVQRKTMISSLEETDLSLCQWSTEP